MSFPLDSLFARYEARLQSGLSDNSHVSVMPDHSGNSYTLYQAGANSVYRTNIKNGQPAYYIGGSGYFSASSIDHPGLASNDAQVTISVVLNSNATNSSKTWPFGTTYSDSSSIFAFTDGASSGKFGYFLRGASGDGQQNLDIVDTLWYVLTLSYDGSTVKAYVNGAEVASHPASGTQPMNYIRMGNIVGQNWEGYILGAYIWKKGLTTEERAAFHSYVQDTYGIGVSDYIYSGGNLALAESTDDSAGTTTYTFGFNSLYVVGQSFLGLQGNAGAFVVRMTGVQNITSGHMEAVIYENVTGTVGSNARPLSDTPIAVSAPRTLPFLSAGSDDIYFYFYGDNRILFDPSKSYVIGVRFIKDTYDQYASVSVVGGGGGHYGNYTAKRQDQSNFTSVGTVDLFMRLYTIEPSGDRPLIEASSVADSGFTNFDNPSDTSPFNSGDTISYTVQQGLMPGLYYWRVRAKDPAGSGEWGDWSSPRTFEVTSSSRNFLAFFYP